MELIHPAVSEICVSQNLDPICGKFDKFLAHGQVHMVQMGKWPWRCTTTGIGNSTELRMEKSVKRLQRYASLAATRPAARPWRQYPSSPKGWGVKSSRCQEGLIRVRNSSKREFLMFLLRNAKQFYKTTQECKLVLLQRKRIAFWINI